MQRLLIVNADDYGLSPGVSRGILAAARTGVVSSTTVMANLVEPADLEALIESGLSAGVHLNLTCGPALTSYLPDMLDDRGWFIKDLERIPSLKDTLATVKREWQAQIDELRGRGLRITHLDSHHHVHFQPWLFELSTLLASEQGVGLRAHDIQSRWAATALVPSTGRVATDFFGAGSIGREQFVRILQEPGKGPLEIMCHPGYVDDALRSRSGYLEERERELEVLADPRLKSIVEDMGWHLGGYDALAEVNEARN